MKTIKICKQCNKEFKVGKYRKDRALFCSMDCYNKFRLKRITIRICKYCGKEFRKKKISVEKGRGKYCSKICLREDKKRIETACKYCGKIMLVKPNTLKHNKGKYCSRSCTNKARKEFSTYRGKNNPLWQKRVNCICQWCGKTFKREKWYVKKGHGKYCSMDCMYNGEVRGKNAYNWKGGHSYEPYSREFKKLRYPVRIRDNFTCQICKEGENGRHHCVHHIDYNKDNNKLNNLVTLCLKCHLRTNYNREDWNKYFNNKKG